MCTVHALYHAVPYASVLTHGSNATAVNVLFQLIISDGYVPVLIMPSTYNMYPWLSDHAILTKLCCIWSLKPGKTADCPAGHLSQMCSTLGVFHLVILYAHVILSRNSVADAFWLLVSQVRTGQGLSFPNRPAITVTRALLKVQLD